MKKDRNSFFEGSSMNMASFSTPQMPTPMPFSAQAQASQSFYANTGAPINQMAVPYPNMNMMPTQTPNTPNQMGIVGIPESNISELESRMAKLERSINRLDTRLSKLEGNTFYSTDTYENTSQGMYMV